jgi:hypothetical protein
MSELLDEFKRNMPSPDEVAKTAIDRGLAGKKGGPDYIKKNFSRLVEELEGAAYRVYLSAQKEAWKKGARRYCEVNLKKNAKPEEIADFMAEHFEDFDEFFMSVFQSRKARAGSAFEDIIKELVRRLDYPFDEQQIINGKPDFLMPSRAYYDKNAPDCIIFTVKRTLRERWRQIVTEGTRGLGFFLATIDDAVSENNLEEMKKNRIYLVVPASLKSKITHYKDAVNVISFEDFFDDYLDPAMKRWKKAGVV